MTVQIQVELSPGELIDKITILEIKLAQISEPEKLANIRIELEILTNTRNAAIPSDEIISNLTKALREVNSALWTIEDEIRDREAAKDFGARFIELARAVYRTNDRRAEIKREINSHLGSRIVEEKSYRDY